MQHPSRHPLPEHLPVEEEIIELEEDLTDKVKIGEEVTDILEYTLPAFTSNAISAPSMPEKTMKGWSSQSFLGEHLLSSTLKCDIIIRR